MDKFKCDFQAAECCISGLRSSAENVKLLNREIIDIIRYTERYWADENTENFIERCMEKCAYADVQIMELLEMTEETEDFYKGMHAAEQNNIQIAKEDGIV
ncbi:MAG: hypothetical protein ACI4I9_07985 [Porcipelethomonas sp.]